MLTLVVEADVAVATPLGTVAGCDHFQLAGVLPGSPIGDIAVEGEVWRQPDLGVIKAYIAQDVPLGP